MVQQKGTDTHKRKCQETIICLAETSDKSEHGESLTKLCKHQNLRFINYLEA